MAAFDCKGEADEADEGSLRRGGRTVDGGERSDDRPDDLGHDGDQLARRNLRELDSLGIWRSRTGRSRPGAADQLQLLPGGRTSGEGADSADRDWALPGECRVLRGGVSLLAVVHAEVPAD